MIVYPPK